MRNKYKNLQNRGQSQKGSSFVIPENRNQILADNNINYIHKNSFISNFDKKERDEKISNKANDKDKKRNSFGKQNLPEKQLDSNISQKKINNTIKTSNHNILISVYTKDSSNKKESVTTNNTNTNRNLNNNKTYTTKIDNTNKNVNNNTNSTVISRNNINNNNSNNNNNNNNNSNNKQNGSKIIFNSKRQNQSQNQNNQYNTQQDKKLNTAQNFSDKKPNKNQQEKKQLEIIEIKYNKNTNDKDKIKDKNKDKDKDKNKDKDKDNKNDKNKHSILNYRRKKNCASYNNIINNTEINKENNNNTFYSTKKNNEKNTKPEIKEQKPKYNHENTHNYNSTSNMPIINKKENITCYNNNNNYNSTTERNNIEKKKLLNFRKLRKKENNSNDDKSVNSPATSYILSPNNNFSTRIRRKMTYRSKRVNRNLGDDNEQEEINNDKNNNNENNDKIDNLNNENISKRNYIIKVTKTPNESNVHKSIDNQVKTEDLNAHKKKIRHFLYYKANKEEKEDNMKKEKNFSPKIYSNSTISHSEINNSSPKNDFKKASNRMNKVSPKQSFKELIHETSQNKNLHDSFSNIFQSCKSDINNKNYMTNTFKNQDLNNSFTCFSNELELNLGNKSQIFNYINNPNISSHVNNSSNNITSSDFNNYRNNSITRNKISIIKPHSPSNIIYRKKMNLIKSISNYYKKNIGMLSPKYIFNSNSNSNIKKFNNMDKVSIKNVKRENNSPFNYNNVSNNIINNNTFNTTLNIYKMNEITLKDKKKQNNLFVTKLKKDKNKDELVTQTEKEQKDIIDPNNKKHIRTNSQLSEIKSTLYFSIFNENSSNSLNENNSNIINVNSTNNINTHKKNKSINSTCSDLSEIINNNSQKLNENNDYNNSDKYKINLEILYILEAKLQNIINKINIYMICPNECFDLITYYFSSKFYEKEIKLFKLKHNINNISYYIKLELLCYFLCYDVCFNKSFSQTGILLKTIFNLLHNNYLILISFILNENINNSNNSSEWVTKLKDIIKKNLKENLSPQDFNETNILSLIGNNLKEVNNYYKMIIDNLYSHFYTKKHNKKNYNDPKYKFPNCLQLDINDLDYYEKLNIISLFFFDAYRLLNNYNFEDLKYFFDSFLQRIKFSNQKKSEKKLKSLKNKLTSSDKKNFSMKNIIIYKYNYSNGNFYYLPPMKKFYKYTLVLDLDETLVYLMPNNIYLTEEGKIGEAKHTLIFRPGLLDFLKKMKTLFELVIFSFGTLEYVDSVIKIIEKNEKFFEHVLYRQHATVNSGEYIKDLSLLGRDLKNIIIVDDIPQVFKLQERNGICIKAFYGDIVSDRNTLKILGKILERVRFDADEDGDIRKSLDKQRSLIFTHITTNME